MNMARYRWQYPVDWLSEAALKWDERRLYQAVLSLAGRLDSDAIQDLFQEDMDADGYFTDLDAPEVE